MKLKNLRTATTTLTSENELIFFRGVIGQESQEKVSEKKNWSEQNQEKSGEMASKSVNIPILTNIFETFLWL